VVPTSQREVLTTPRPAAARRDVIERRRKQICHRAGSLWGTSGEGGSRSGGFAGRSGESNLSPPLSGALKLPIPVLLPVRSGLEHFAQALEVALDFAADQGL
jgi:hypothetical protein